MAITRAVTDVSRSDATFGTTGDRLDALLRALADEQPRQVIRYFETVEDDVASVADLVDCTVEGDSSDTARTRIEAEFHHVTLPRLATLGVIEYDARSRTVRYHGAPVVVRLLDGLDDTDRGRQ